MALRLSLRAPSVRAGAGPQSGSWKNKGPGERAAPPPPHVRGRRGALGLGLGLGVGLVAGGARAASCPEGSYNNGGICMSDPASYNVEAARKAGADKREELADQEQPGTLVTLPSGVQYREIEVGTGPLEAELGSVCEVRYKVFRLSSGAYFKYSSGGKPVYLFSLGYGEELQDDLDKVFRFTLGTPGELPRAAPPALAGMRAGGVRRVLVPPYQGWNNASDVKLRPADYGARRRLENHKDEPLLLEAEMVRVYAPGSFGAKDVKPGVLNLPQGSPYRLPAPPGTTAAPVSRR